MTQSNFPEEYTRGYVTYLGKKIFVTDAVLIPRLETEVLIKYARKILQEKEIKTIIDIGTGSGIIPISLRERTDATMYATDISPEALMIAEKNFRQNFSEKSCTFIESNLLEGIHTLETPLLITANLPYVKENDWENMSSDTRYEPKLALFGGEKTGFELYEKFLLELSEKELKNTIVLIEFGYDQAGLAEKWVREFDWKYEIFADYAGIRRFMRIDIEETRKKCSTLATTVAR